MLIRAAEIWRGPILDLRIRNGRIAEMGELTPLPDELAVDAAGSALLPGLHDHHIHLAATAASLQSVPCGPPAVRDANGLARTLRQDGTGWLRGIGYHESVAGMLDRRQVDAMVADRPVRIQHRTGRMWFFNSLALEILLALDTPPEGLDEASGQLFDADDWLRRVLASVPPDLGRLSRQLAAFGITGVTDMSPSNDHQTVKWLGDERRAGRLLQRCLVAGQPVLAATVMPKGLSLGPLKLHLHEAALPDIDETSALIADAHAASRPIAVHCTTETELVFALAALDQAGARAGDRIEHASLADDALVARCAELGVQVVSQPHFILERGEQYRETIPAEDWQNLYRLASFTRAGLTLAGGSDAPYGSTDPWMAMRAAVERRTSAGNPIGEGEALSPEDALDLYLRHPQDLTISREIAPGGEADLCLLDRPWATARDDLDASCVRMTLSEGEVIHDRSAPGTGEG